jgi:PIN domain nuclease of toxin-antitoxin system
MATLLDTTPGLVGDTDKRLSHSGRDDDPASLSNHDLWISMISVWEVANEGREGSVDARIGRSSNGSTRRFRRKV